MMLSLAVLLASLAQTGSALIPCWKGYWCASGWKCRQQICTFNWFQKCKYCIWESWGREEFDASAMVFDDAQASVLDDAAASEFETKFKDRAEFEAALRAAEKTLSEADADGSDGSRAEISVLDKPEQWFARVWPVPAVVAAVALAAICILAAVVKMGKPSFGARPRGLLAAAA